MDFTFICYFTISTFVVAIVVVDVNGDVQLLLPALHHYNCYLNSAWSQISMKPVLTGCIVTSLRLDAGCDRIH